ncbi:hypothetical protein LshimejAT787_1200390 [Lyophyllum shimeji]|uniref:F-box domain-containing protein n=1 Tax=Lyophyllum shimeji TaxID=47721 RepID=A0A9P3PV52_LYOSH|nr:hypothetical protein LshimejAT787_1200390 [Lyophyllum shimeji]
MAAMNAPELPPELMDTILDHVGADRPTLVACNSVSTTFHAAARRKLFQAITIDTSMHREARNEKLLQVLLSNPQIVELIQHLSLITSSQMTRSAIDALHMLKGVPRALTIAHPSYALQWRKLDGDVRTAIMTLMQSVEHFTLNGVTDFPLELLRCCPRLRILEVLQSYPLGDQEDIMESALISRITGSPKGFAIQLESLRVPHPGPCRQFIVHALNNPKSVLSLSLLRSFESTIDDRDSIAHSQRVLDTAAGSLQHLETHVLPGFDTSAHLDLTKLAQLTHLRFFVFGGLRSPSLKWACDVLASLPFANSLEEVHLLVAGSFATVGNEATWQAVDRVLGDRGKHGRLRKGVHRHSRLLGQDLGQISEGEHG